MTIQTISLRHSLIPIALAGLAAALPIIGVAVVRDAGRAVLELPAPSVDGENATAEAPGAGEHGTFGMWVPRVRRDRVEGIQLFDVEQQAFARDLGLLNGDVLLSINGIALTSPEALRAALDDVQEERHASIELLRDGRTATLTRTLEQNLSSWNEPRR